MDLNQYPWRLEEGYFIQGGCYMESYQSKKVITLRETAKNRQRTKRERPETHNSFKQKEYNVNLRTKSDSKPYLVQFLGYRHNIIIWMRSSQVRNR